MGIASLDGNGKLLPTQVPNVPWSLVTGAPTKLSQFQNDTGFITSSALTSYATNTSVQNSINNALTLINNRLVNYPTLTGLNNTLSGYVQTSALNSALNGYVQTSALNSALTGYTNTAALNTLLGNYTTTANLNTMLGGYVQTSQLGVPNGVPQLDANGLIPLKFIPPTAGTTVTTTAGATLATVATTGSYADLLNIPVFAKVATSGNYSDLLNIPTFSKVASTGSYADLSNLPTFATIATSGKYTDLLNLPTFAKVATSGNYGDLQNTPTLAKVATSGNYSDLNGVPATNVPNGLVQLDSTGHIPSNLVNAAPTVAGGGTVTSAPVGSALVTGTGNGVNVCPNQTTSPYQLCVNSVPTLSSALTQLAENQNGSYQVITGSVTFNNTISVPLPTVPSASSTPPVSTTTFEPGWSVEFCNRSGLTLNFLGAQGVYFMGNTSMTTVSVANGHHVTIRSTGLSSNGTANYEVNGGDSCLANATAPSF